MTLFPDLLFFFNIPIFISAVIISFFIPGDLFLSSVKLKTLPRLTLSTVCGICLFAIQGLVVGYLQMRFLSYIYLAFCFVIWFLKKKKLIFIDLKVDKISFLLIIFGTLAAFSGIWPTGERSKSGIRFCCLNTPDVIYHLALTNELIKNFPPFEPGSSGIIVKNYHYLSNLVLADLIRIFHLPIIPLVYQYMPFLMSFLLGFCMIIFCDFFHLPKGLSRLILLSLFFSGDIGFLYPLFNGKSLQIEAKGIFDNALWILTAPPRLFSFVIFLADLFFIASFMKEKTKIKQIIIILLTGSLIGFKVYTFIPLYVGLMFLAVYQFVFKKDYSFALIFFLVSIVAFLIYYPINSGVGGLVFVGNWRAKDFIVSDSIKLSTLELARQTYASQHNWKRVFFLEGYFIFLYVLLNLGITNLAFLPLKKLKEMFSKEIYCLIFLINTILLFLGLFFIQETGGSNTLQFLITLIFTGSIFSAGAIFIIYKKLPKVINLIFLGIIIVLLCTRSLASLFFNIQKRQNEKNMFVVSNDEIQAFQYLNKKTPPSSVVAVSHDFALGDYKALIVPLFSNREVFLASISDHGVRGLKERIIQNEKIFTAKNQKQLAQILLKNNIQYIFVMKNDAKNFKFKKSIKNLTKKFENKKITIYQFYPECI